MDPAYQMAHVGVKGLLFRADRLLILHRRDDLNLVPGLWDLPGGGVETGETLEGALDREVREETGFRVRVGPAVHAWISHHPLRTGGIHDSTIVCFECHLRATGEPRIDPGEHSEFAWVSSRDLARYPMPQGIRDSVRKGFATRRNGGTRGR